MFTYKKNKSNHKTSSLDQLQNCADFADYILLNLESGHSLEHSFFQGATQFDAGTLKCSVLKIYTSRHSGLSFTDSISDFLKNHRENDAFHEILENLKLSLKLGSPLIPILNHLSYHFRLLATTQLEELGNRAPVKMIFPLVIFIFPVILILLSAGAIENLLQTFYF
jgi:tight adherence protein C